MLSQLTANGRIWILLIAWILFTGFCMADMFDLSDDIVLPTAVGQPAVAPDSAEVQKPHALVLNNPLHWHGFEPLSLIFDRQVSPLFSILFLQSDTPLHQRHSVYRI